MIENTLKVTGFDYIDLMLLHAPYGGREARKGAWKALVEAKDAGKIHSIGISNYGVHHLDEMEEYMKELEKEGGNGGEIGNYSHAPILHFTALEADLPSPITAITEQLFLHSLTLLNYSLDIGQWELHPWLPRDDIVQWCEKRSIAIEAYCPLVQGHRLGDKLLKPLVKKYGKTPAQILLRWSLQKGFIPLPKSVTPSRIEENAALFDFELTEEDMNSLKTTQYSPVRLLSNFFFFPPSDFLCPHGDCTHINLDYLGSHRFWTERLGCSFTSIGTLGI